MWIIILGILCQFIIGFWMALYFYNNKRTITATIILMFTIVIMFSTYCWLV